ncbi:SDR family oxidoreductase [Catenovulum sp. 2E275]|uniref:NAD-dependent epimerase/dehydratase family protein n=1 Tax=Catenovulum sp. 2E275 TaxID=2980497 RepID=UPI0021D37681|nr:SDR family oxidoreductase [Catenovulum sp. 2E275]MCU4674731.1 SDR family oxidoreductase [Catenovulum sp. 2E275]
MKIQISGENGRFGRLFIKNAAKQNIRLEPSCYPSADCDVFIHLAAKSPLASKAEIIHSNLSYLSDILAKINPNTLLIFASTISVYEHLNGLLDETLELRPSSIYAQSKKMGEELIKSFHSNHLIFRFPAILADHSDLHLIARLLKQCQQQGLIKLTNADKPFNNFIHADDLSAFLISILSHQKLVNGVFNIAYEPVNSLKNLMLNLLSSDKVQCLDVPNSPHIIVSTERFTREFGRSFKLNTALFKAWAEQF